MIRIFVGYTEGAGVLYDVLQHSIQRHSSQPVSIAPIMLRQLRGIHARPRDPKQSTDFSFSRFLVPHLCGFDGWAIYMDNDMLLRGDIALLWALRDPCFALMCVQHEHVAAETTKFLGQPQTAYAKKNWSSLMLFNCGECKALTPEYVERASGLDLHQFRWLGDDARIGDLPKAWNHLVGVDPPDAEAKNVHFTLGGPYYEGYESVEFAAEWRAEREHLRGSGDFVNA